MNWIRSTNGPGCAARRWCRSATKYGAMNEQASAGRAGHLSEPEHHWHVRKRCLKASPYPSLTSGRQCQTRPSGARLVSRAEPRGLQTVHATRSREMCQNSCLSVWRQLVPGRQLSLRLEAASTRQLARGPNGARPVRLAPDSCLEPSRAGCGATECRMYRRVNGRPLVRCHGAVTAAMKVATRG